MTIWLCAFKPSFNLFNIMGYAMHLKVCVDSYNYTNLLLSAAEQIKSNEDIKCIVVTGISGISVGAILSFYSSKPLVIVRKKGDQNHSSYEVESSLSTYLSGGFIFVDDLIASGTNFKKADQALAKSHPNLKCTYYWLYHWPSFDKTKPSRILDVEQENGFLVRKILADLRESKKKWKGPSIA